MRNLFLLVFLLFTLFVGGCSYQKENPKKKYSLEEGFRQPPKSAKSKGYWCLVNGNFDLAQMTEELKEFKDKGMGTLDIWDVAGWVDPNGVEPAGPPFMGDESVQAVAHAIREAGKLGIDIGLTISSSWNAGGSWVKPEDGVMGLFDTSLTVQGPRRYRASLPFPHIPETFAGKKMLLYKRNDGLPTFFKEVALLAYSVSKDSIVGRVIDISGKFTEGILTWNVPPGEWHITRYVVTGTGQTLMVPSPNSNGLMIDHFSAKAMRKHLNYFFERLENELGDLSQTALKYLYTDSYEANSAAWTVKLPEEFQKRRGYSLIPYLPTLRGYIVQDRNTTERFLFDFKKTLSDLIIENHYALGKKLCNEKGIGFIAEAGGPGPPVHNCPFESIRALGSLSAARGEFWFDPLLGEEHNESVRVVKGPASAAHLYNLPRVEAEAFTGTQLWQFGPGDLKATADRVLCEGLNSFVYHTTPHIPREAGIPGWVYNFGTIINTTRAWWPLSSAFHNYLARCSFLLQQGNFVADVLYYYGDEAPNFVKPKRFNPSLGVGYDYDVANTDIILNKLDVKDGRFVLPHGQSYRILVLPDDERIDPTVLQKLSELVKKGGILVGKKPLRSYSLHNYRQNDKRVRELAETMWKDDADKIKYGKGRIYTDRENLRAVLKDLHIMPDITLLKDHPHTRIDFIHRRTEEADIYFLRNTTAKSQVYEIRFRTRNGRPELWNPDNASIAPVSVYIKDDRSVTLPLKLDALASAFIVFRNKPVGRHIVKVELNNERIFPDAEDTFPLRYSDTGLYFERNGDYALTYDDGSLKTYTVAVPDTALAISGPWQIRFPYGWGAPQRVEFEELISWTEALDPGVKFFSGVATYLNTFTMPGEKIGQNNRLILDLGKVSKAAKVFLNGRPLGIVWHAPYRIDITSAVKEGRNYLVVDVANVLSNQMTGDARRAGRDKRTHSNITKGPNAWHTPWKDVPLVESGLLGPVTIHIKREVKCCQ